jgi:hypothetical protein
MQSSWRQVSCDESPSPGSLTAHWGVSSLWASAMEGDQTVSISRDAARLLNSFIVQNQTIIDISVGTDLGLDAWDSNGRSILEMSVDRKAREINNQDGEGAVGVGGTSSQSFRFK